MTESPPPSAPEPVIRLKQLLAGDDSCQQMLYSDGHCDFGAFGDAIEKRVHFASIDASKARHTWMYFRPVSKDEDDLVSDQVAEFVDRPRRGAEPVTVLDVWLPLWERQTYHELHLKNPERLAFIASSS